MLFEIPNKTDEFIIWYYLHDIFIYPTLVSRPLRRFGFSSWVPVYFLLAIPAFLASTAVGRVHRSPENKRTKWSMSWMLLKVSTHLHTAPNWHFPLTRHSETFPFSYMKFLLEKCSWKSKSLQFLRKKEIQKSVSRNRTRSVESAVHHLHHHATEDLRRLTVWFK